MLSVEQNTDTKLVDVFVGTRIFIVMATTPCSNKEESMPVLLSIVTTSDIIEDAERANDVERDKDVKAAIRTDLKARKASAAAFQGRRLIKALEKEDY